jgi:HEXXH motif-containing protein
MDALFELPALAATEVGLRRACQVALLGDRLQGASERELLPGWLETLTPADLLRHATPFFWRNVLRCHAAWANGSPGRDVVLRYLLLTAFDAFFPVAADGFSCRLPAGDDPVLVLPRLGVRLRAGAGPARLSRVRRQVLRVEVGEGEARTVPLDNVPAEAHLVSLPVGSNDSARLLLDSHPALFPDAVAGEIPIRPADAAGQAAMITAALRLIREVDPRRGEQIESAIQWYSSRTAHDSEVHRSRAVPDLPGVTFLSPGPERLKLAEAIIQGYYHHLLDTQMVLQDLVNFGEEPRFYSPWRDDPWPLAGLLHGLYVFTGVVEFLLRAEKSPSLFEE